MAVGVGLYCFRLAGAEAIQPMGRYQEERDATGHIFAVFDLRTSLKTNHSCIPGNATRETILDGTNSYDHDSLGGEIRCVAVGEAR